MKGNTDMNGWSELLHSSSKLLEQAAPSAQFPPLQRNLEQLESLSKKLKAKTVRADTPSQSIAATRLLAREGINAEQLARDLKSFEIKTTYEDVFPSEATTVEEYLQQLHEMAMVSAIQEAQKDNLRNFNDHIMRVFEDDWQKVRKDFLQSLSRLSFLPRINSGLSSSDPKHATQNSSKESSPNVSGIPSDLTPVVNKSVLEKKALVYSETLRILNDSRARGLPFKPATAFREAYERIGLDHSAGKSVTMQKIWHLIQALAGEGFRVQQSVSKRTSLVNGARRHLEWGHEKYIIETIQAHPAQAALGGAVGNLPRIQAFLRVRLRDHGLLDFDAGDACRQPPIDTTWQQIYFCLRTGYYDEARSIAQTSRASHHFAPLLAEWITAGGMVSAETASIASEECDKILRAGDRAGRPGYDRKKLLLYAIASGCRRQIDRLLRDLPTLFNTIEDFMWFKLSAVRDFSGGSSSVVLSDGLVPYSLEDLQGYLNKFEPSYYTKSGKDPLVYPYVLLLSIQLLPAILHLYKEVGEEGYSIDAVHISIVLADQGCISEGSHKIVSIMDSCAEVAGIIRRFGSLYLHAGKLSLSLDYYAQASAVMGGGELSWIGRASVDQQRQRNLMLKQLLTEILLQDGGISLLLGPRGMGEEGELMKYMMDWKTREEFLLEAASQSQEAGLYEKSVDLHKRVGAFAMALTTINKCLSDAIYAMLRGRLDGDSRVASLIQSGKDILEAFKCSHETSLQEKELYYEQQIVFRQLEAILCIHKLARAGKYMDAVREISNLSFLPLNPRMPEVTMDPNLSPLIRACVPDLLKTALNSADSIQSADVTVREFKVKIANFVANNISRSWPQDLYEKVARSI